MKFLIVILVALNLSLVSAKEECLLDNSLNSQKLSSFEEILKYTAPSIVDIELDAKKFRKDTPLNTVKFIKAYFAQSNLEVTDIMDKECVASLFFLNKHYKQQSTLFFLETEEEKAANKIQSNPLVKSVSFQKGTSDYAKYEIKLKSVVYERNLSSLLKVVPAGFTRRYSVINEEVPKSFTLSLKIKLNSSGKPLSRLEALKLASFYSTKKNDGIISAEALFSHSYEI